jgi:hypothetical protein
MPLLGSVAQTFDKGQVNQLTIGRQQICESAVQYGRMDRAGDLANARVAGSGDPRGCGGVPIGWR